MYMDELEISGKRYISTRRAAKEHKYHSDYIGQLIRAGKVEGQKVGRSWYVIADSLADYLGKEGGAKTSVRATAPKPQIIEEKEEVIETIEETEAAIETPEEIVEEVIEQVEEPEVPAVKNNIEIEEEYHVPVRITKQVEIKKEIPTIKASRTSLRYIPDDGPLFPRGEKHSTPQIKIRPIERPIEVVEEETVYVEDEPVTIIERPRVTRSKTWMMRGGAVVALGVVTLGVVAAASAFVVSTTTIAGETASVSYTLGGL